MKHEVNKHSYYRNIDALVPMIDKVVNADFFDPEFNPEVWMSTRDEVVEFATAIGRAWAFTPSEVIATCRNYYHI